MELRYSRKSMLGCRRSHIGDTTSNEVTLKKFELIPKNLQSAETLRKQRSISNNENTYVSAMKNLSVRQPRKSMLGTRKLNRDSIVLPPAPSLSLRSQSHDCLEVEFDHNDKVLEFDLSTNNTLTSSDSKMSVVLDDVPRIPSSEDNILRRDGEHYSLSSDSLGELSKPTILTAKRESLPLHRDVPIREMFPSFSSNSKNSSFIDSETLLVDDESLLATTLNDTTVANDNSLLVSADNSKDGSFIENKIFSAFKECSLTVTPNNTTVTNSNSFLASTLTDVSKEDIVLTAPTLSDTTIANKNRGSFIENEIFLVKKESSLAVTPNNNTVMDSYSFLASTLIDAPKEDLVLTAPSLSDTTIANENSCYESTLKDESKEENIVATSINSKTFGNKNGFLASALKDELSGEIMTTSFTDTAKPNENSFDSIPSKEKFDEENVAAAASNDTTATNRSNLFSTTLRDITNTRIEVPQKTVTLMKGAAQESEESKTYENDMLIKMLDLINTWILRNTETVETYQKEIADLQKKADHANEEIEDMKNLKQTLMKKFSVRNNERENFEVEPMPTTVEDEVLKSSVVSPKKTYIKEMRSTIKFMKTPLNSRIRMPRTSMMLTPHSMSFCLQNQYEQLFE